MKPKAMISWKISLVLLVTVCAALALVFTFQAERRAVVSEFKWTIDGSTSPYSFRIKNYTDEALAVFVTIVAEEITQGDDGVKLLPRGRQVEDIHLAPREDREVIGVVTLTRFGTSGTVLTLSSQLKEPTSKR
ncbi:MAG TPA: hypothetical protein VMM36_03245 [Opitutaceae bacterium]|nr:hypothetical protein [Opitutaceae bacterium]